MTTDHVEIRAGAYADSVTLLQVSRQVQQHPGVVTAQVAMGTPLNAEVLDQMGFVLPDGVSANHLVVAVRVVDDVELAPVRAEVDRLLATRRTDTGAATEEAPRTTASALARQPDAVVLVSVPGTGAAVEAMDALEAGSDVMVFSDHVPLEQEVALKRRAADRGLLVMGPDCGTAVVDGLGLGFANVVAPGPVGIVAASGTGCQQVLALLDHAGVGVTTAYGVGGRDLSAAVGGLSTRTALARLDADPRVELALVISKPPDAEVAAGLTSYAEGLATPVQLALVGAGRPDLTAAAEAVLRALGREVPAWPVAGRAEPAGGSALQGLFVGGTLRDESAAILEGVEGVELVDFGDDAYTTGRAHPMIDPSLRLARLAEVVADPETAVVLLDVVLGHGVEPDPAASLAPVIAGARPPVVVSVVGTSHDPQQRGAQVAALVAAGAEVHLSHAGATRRALEILRGDA